MPRHRPKRRPELWAHLPFTGDLETLRESWREKQFHLWNYTPLFSFILISTFKESKKKKQQNIASIRVMETFVLQSRYKVNLDVQRCIWFLLGRSIGHFWKVEKEKKKKTTKKERKYVLKDDFVVYFSDAFKINSSKNRFPRNAAQLSECYQTLRLIGLNKRNK